MYIRLSTKIQVIWKYYIQGVSTRKIRKLAGRLGIESIDEQGKGDILAILPMPEESETTYKTLFDHLKSRGIQDVWMVISDAHKGLAKAIKESFIGCSWQRCNVHFMRNILAHIPSREKESFASRLKPIWLQPDYTTAMNYADSLMDEYEEKNPDAMKVLY